LNILKTSTLILIVLSGISTYLLGLLRFQRAISLHLS
jgi:uncharacterized membrane protein YuzA (DUF378 family)